ncbi:MAG: BrnT family toxin [Candidatus Mariimomonas ferrooxydans]
MKWDEFIPSEFEYDLEKDKLRDHNVTFEEAVETFFNDYEVRRNKRFRDRWQLIGQTDGGRKLKIIFQLKSGNIVRIITGWQI